MSSLNTVILLGNLVRDIELSYTPSGKPVAKCSLAVSNKYTDTKGVEIDKPLFIDVVIWNKQAEATATYMHKGDQLFIQGKLELDKWEDKEGTKHQKHKVVASKVVFGSNKKGNSQASVIGPGIPDQATDESHISDYPIQ